MCLFIDFKENIRTFARFHSMKKKSSHHMNLYQFVLERSRKSGKLICFIISALCLSGYLHFIQKVIVTVSNLLFRRLKAIKLMAQ